MIWPNTSEGRMECVHVYVEGFKAGMLRMKMSATKIMLVSYSKRKQMNVNDHHLTAIKR